jgi:predicted AlkP superfamily phosphohydrolase/phosphomutase
VHPKSLIPQLQELDYRLDVDSQVAHSSMSLFLSDLDETLEARIRAYRHLWQTQDWQTFMLVFTGTDRLMHFLFDAYGNKNHKYHNTFLEHFNKIDRIIGEISDRLTDDDLLIMLSDHGFEKLEKDIYVNWLLANEGFLTFKPNTKPVLVNIDSDTAAFALDPARIYINQKGKYPVGSVNSKDRDACLRDLESLFSSLQVDGRKVIKHIYRKEDIYTGPYLDGAPDLVLVAEKGFNLKAAMTAEQLAGKGPFTGKHTYEDAFLLLKDRNLAVGLPDEMSVTDVGTLIGNLVQKQ